jgi:sulfur-oxidizing protein SoxB
MSNAMNLSRREFQVSWRPPWPPVFPLREAGAAQAASLYELPRSGNVHLLHMTDCHAQLLPIYFREPSVNLGVGAMRGQAPHLVGEHLLKAASLKSGTPEAHALTFLNFEKAARQYGKVGGFAHLATLVKQLKGGRPGALLLDGGDTWQGSATALWTQGQDMVDAAKLLGVDVMTGHWDFTYGEERIKKIVEQDFAGKIDFVAQNVKTSDFGDPVFKPYVIKEMNGVPVAIVGQAFPYTPIANPAWLTPNWSFRHPRKRDAGNRERGARQGCPGRGAAEPQRHGCGPEDGLARHRHRCDPGRPHA